MAINWINETNRWRFGRWKAFWMWMVQKLSNMSRHVRLQSEQFKIRSRSHWYPLVSGCLFPQSYGNNTLWMVLIHPHIHWRLQQTCSWQRYWKSWQSAVWGQASTYSTSVAPVVDCLDDAAVPIHLGPVGARQFCPSLFWSLAWHKSSSTANPTSPSLPSSTGKKW